MKSTFTNLNIGGAKPLQMAVTSDGRELLKAIDVARILGYKQPSAAIKRLCKNPVLIDAPVCNQYGGRNIQPVRFIDYDDVMRMINGSTLPAAETLRALLLEDDDEQDEAPKAEPETTGTKSVMVVILL